jgi:hypothetical protein
MTQGRKILAWGLVGTLAGMALSSLALMFWITQYPEDYDPKNIEYVLWTHGLNRNMNLDHALGGMTHDTWAVRLVAGLTEAQLKDRFGVVRSLSEARPYDQLCSTQEGAVGERGVHAAGKQVLYRRDSDWMVIMDQGRAVDLVLCKGY